MRNVRKKNTDYNILTGKQFYVGNFSNTSEVAIKRVVGVHILYYNIQYLPPFLSFMKRIDK